MSSLPYKRRFGPGNEDTGHVGFSTDFSGNRTNQDLTAVAITTAADVEHYWGIHAREFACRTYGFLNVGF